MLASALIILGIVIAHIKNQLRIMYYNVPCAKNPLEYDFNHRPHTSSIPFQCLYSTPICTTPLKLKFTFPLATPITCSTIHRTDQLGSGTLCTSNTSSQCSLNEATPTNLERSWQLETSSLDNLRLQLQCLPCLCAWSIILGTAPYSLLGNGSLVGTAAANCCFSNLHGDPVMLCFMNSVHCVSSSIA